MEEVSQTGDDSIFVTYCCSHHMVLYVYSVAYTALYSISIGYTLCTALYTAYTTQYWNNTRGLTFNCSRRSLKTLPPVRNIGC